MLRLIICFLFFSFHSYGLEVGHVVVDIDQLNFFNDKGDIVTRNIYVGLGKVKKEQQEGHDQLPMNLKIERDLQSIKLQSDFLSLVWRGIPNWLLANLGIKGRDLRVSVGNGEESVVVAKELFVQKPSLGEIKIDNFKIICEKNNGRQGVIENILFECLKKGRLTGEKVYAPKLRDFLLQEVLRESKRVKEMVNLGESLEIALLNNTYHLFIKTFFMNVGLRAHGNIIIDEKSNMASIRINMIRFGKLNITKLSFPFLKKTLSREGVIVKRPFIYLQL